MIGLVERALHMTKGELKSKLVSNGPLIVATDRCLDRAKSVQSRLQSLDEELNKPKD